MCLPPRPHPWPIYLCLCFFFTSPIPPHPIFCIRYDLEADNGHLAKPTGRWRACAYIRQQIVVATLPILRATMTSRTGRGLSSSVAPRPPPTATVPATTRIQRRRGVKCSVLLLLHIYANVSGRGCQSISGALRKVQSARDDISSPDDRDKQRSERGGLGGGQ